MNPITKRHTAIIDEGPPIIGLAGGIGSGKSTVAGMLRELGAFVSDSDVLARAALGDPAIKAEIERWWGGKVLDQQAEIDRQAVAEIVFKSPTERRRLERLVHPWVEARRKEQFAAAPRGSVALVIDAPLLFEVGLDDQCDAVIYVDAAAKTRRSRVLAARGWTSQQLAQREASQLPLDQKRSRADYVVQNDGDLPTLKAQVSRILNGIVQTRRSPG